MSTDFDLFAITAHGLADVCASELHALGVDATAVTGGVEWRGDMRSMYRANLELRSASRVIVRVGRFRARGFAELERRLARLSWNAFLAPGTDAAMRVTSRKSKLYHEGAIAERVARVLTGAAGVNVIASRDNDDDADATTDAAVTARDEARDQAQLIIVRFLRDECTISIDSSGALLHLRGYRQAVAKAPLRETIAAGMLLASGWRGESPLLDPFCGSGTIPIEAALLARGIAPGIASEGLTPRRYEFEHWPVHDVGTWSEMVEAARSAVRTSSAAIIGSDRDAGAIGAARENAHRAGVAEDIEFRHAAVSGVDLPVGRGHLVTNPPYGVRVGDRISLRRLYAAFGRVVRERLPDWSVAMLSADDVLAAATGLPFRERLSTRNGGIPVRLLMADLAGSPHIDQDAVYQTGHEPADE